MFKEFIKPMCTLSFLPTVDGFRLGMNRDEQRTRPKACIPQIHPGTVVPYLAPCEPNGGTWIAMGVNGNVFALLNWYAVASAKVIQKPKSRGTVIPATIHCEHMDALKENLQNMLNTHPYAPFRLITFLSQAKACLEWQYDGKTLMQKPHEWNANLWASSGSDEPAAQATRQNAWRKRLPIQPGEEATAIKTFHQSHEPKKGAFSVCMHREEAQTVSYTEIHWSAKRYRMSYVNGPPCQSNAIQPDFTEIAP